jgi:hypothetical protein
MPAMSQPVTSALPVAGSSVDDADEVGEGWLVAPSDVVPPPLHGSPQPLEVESVPSLFCWLVVSQFVPGCGSELGVDGGADSEEVGGAVVSGDDVLGVEVDGGTDVEGAVVVEDEVGTDVVLLGVVVVVVQTSTAAFGWVFR